MSRFTPCNRLVKETINVELDDRITEQKVVFNNEDNVYRGHFIGDANLVGVSGGGSTISNYGIAGSTLSGCDFVDENGQNVGLAEFHGEILSAMDGLVEYVQLLSSRIGTQVSGFDYDTLSSNDGLSSVWDEGYDEKRGDIPLETFLGDVLSGVRYICQTLGGWKSGESPRDGGVPDSGGSQRYIRW
jgi:hypothetical protein